VSFNSGFRRRSVIGPVLVVLLLIWLVVGAVAADFRHYFEDTTTCASVRTIAVTILAGPLNYTGANPELHC
jgi:putative effector of murein hydrolase